MGPVMEAKGTVTNEILEMIEDDPRVCYVNADSSGIRIGSSTLVFRK